MANLFNPALAMACAAGVVEGLLFTRGMNVASGGTGAAPSATAADYATFMNVGLAVAQKVDTTLGQGFDTGLASNANPGVTVALSGAGGAAGSAALGSEIKPLLMSRIAAGFFLGRSSVDTTAADWATVASAIAAAYQEAVAVIFTANAS